MAQNWRVHLCLGEGTVGDATSAIGVAPSRIVVGKAEVPAPIIREGYTISRSQGGADTRPQVTSQTYL
jgi:hypothetical protein